LWGDLSRIWKSCFGFVAHNTLICFRFPISQFWAYLMKVIPETRQ
jgi:hypothetical protein